MSTVARTMSATKIQKDILFEFKASTVKYGVDFRLIPLELGLVWFGLVFFTFQTKSTRATSRARIIAGRKGLGFSLSGLRAEPE